MAQNHYFAFILQQAPRVLSQIDRDPDSPTYGCCDRNFWHYKIRDFSSAILQQSGYGLALLYSFKFPGNIYYQKEEIKNIALATVSYWQKIQHNDGSFDEYWPSERSIPATVFSLIAVCGICRVLEIEHPKIKRAVAKAARFLVKHQELQALNQEIASMYAVYSAGLLLCSPLLRLHAEKKLRKLLSLQNEEGWFAEYGGADLGYLTVSLNFMAEYYELSHDSRAKNSMINMIDFLKYFVHPDGSFGGDYGSRNTEYFLPAGFEIAAPFHPTSGTVADRLLNYSLDNFSVDDRYLTHYVFTSLVRAAMLYRARKSREKLPSDYANSRYFKNAGLYVKSNDTYYLVSALSKGGVTVIFDKKIKKRAINDCGYRAFVGNKLAVTNWVSGEYKVQLEEKEYGKKKIRTLRIISPFYRVKFHTPTILQHILLRLASFFLKRSLVSLMKKIFIFPSKKTAILLKRKITLCDDAVLIDDEVRSPQPVSLLKSSEGLSLRYCPSSKFYQNSVLDRKNYHFVEIGVRKAEFRKEILFR